MSLSKKDKQEINEFVKKITEKYGDKIISIILFGSAARGKLSPVSDIDTLVIVKKRNFKLWQKFISVATDLMLKYNRYISVKVYDYKQYKYLNRLETHFMKKINKNGKILWKTTN